MELQYQPDFERVRTYWRAFWAHETIDRPLVYITAPKDPAHQPPYTRELIQAYASPAAMFDAFETWAAGTYFAGESVPFLNASFGTDQFSSWFGTTIVPAPDFATAWAHPVVDDWEGYEVRFRDGPGSEFEKVLAYYREGAKRSEGKYLLGMLDLHSNLDCLSAMRGPEALCMDFYDAPEAVEAAMKVVRAAYKPIYDRLYEAGGMQGRGSIGWIPFYSEGRFAGIQSDVIAMLSPEQFRRYVRPALEEEAAMLDHCVFHLDGKDALRHLDDILEIKDIDVIQWVPGAGQPRTVEWMDVLKRIQKAGKGLHLYDWHTEEIKRLHKELRPEGLMFQAWGDDPAQADDLLAFLKKDT